MTVTLATHCHFRDLPRLHAPGVLEELIDSHQYYFDEILVVHQRCAGIPYALPPGELGKRIKVLNIFEEDYPFILTQFGIPASNAHYDENTHGWNGPHFWQHHCVNHLKEIQEATSDYIVFSDADCRILNQPSSWILEAKRILEKYPDIFMVSPSDGGYDFDHILEGGARALKMTSQQLFMARAKDMKALDFRDLQWDGTFIQGGPFQEFYVLLEGWLYRWMRKHNLYRAILPEQWRYWHSEWH